MTRAIAVLAGVAFASSAAAQAPDSYRQLTDREAAEELAVFADCVASKRTERARRLAMAPYGSEEQTNAASSVYIAVDDYCIQSGFNAVRISVRPDVLAAAVAAAVLRRDYPDLPAVLDRSALDVEAERARAAQLSVAERFGRCVVWNDPAGVQALLGTEAGSSEERQAIAALQQDMGMCLEEGSTLRLNRPFVRYIAAISAYRLAQQIRPRGRGRERG